MSLSRGALLAALLCGFLTTHPARADAPSAGETVSRNQLRVCADPANLPLSDKQGQGFENRIAERLAERLGRPVAYTWYPQSMGFVRNTLRARRCDLVIGVVAADEMMQNTNPYYRSSWVLVYRKTDEGRFSDLTGPDAAKARIGVVAGSPAADLLQRLGLLAGAHPYQLLTDTSIDQPGRAMIGDLAEGRLDIALLWGPIAGWWAKQQSVPLALVPLKSDPRTGLRLDFRISMGVRQGEPDWKHQLNQAIKELQPDFDTILDAYAVPRLDNAGRLVGVWAMADASSPRGRAGRLPDGPLSRSSAIDPARRHGARYRRLAAAAGGRAPADPRRCAAATAQARGPAGRQAVDRAEAPAHSGLDLAAQYRPRRAAARDGGVVRQQAGSAHRRRQGQAAGLLLRPRLLDVVERGPPCDHRARLHVGALVSGRRHRLARGRPPAGGSRSGKWAMRLAHLWLGLMLLATGPAAAQGMMQHVDLATPRMTQAELTRGDVVALIAATPGKPIVLTDKSLNGLDLSALDLSGADLRWARLNKANLRGTKLAQARLDLAWALEADFTGADLQGATLMQAQLIKARLDGANLGGAAIVGNFEGASFKGARLVGVAGSPDMRNQSMGLMRAVLRQAVLDGADLSGASLQRADLEFAKLRRATLTGADMTRAKLGGADLTGAQVAGLDVSLADLASAVLYDLVDAPRMVGLDSAYNLNRSFRR